jgi:hypothetical protein
MALGRLPVRQRLVRLRDRRIHDLAVLTGAGGQFIAPCHQPRGLVNTQRAPATNGFSVKPTAPRSLMARCTGAKAYANLKGQPGAATTADDRQTEMEWEEALLRAWGGARPPRPASYYRRNADRARQIAEGVTTRSMRARVLDEALHCDQLAADADREMLGEDA